MDTSPITVSGTIDDDTASVEVNGIAGIVENGTFTVTGVPLVQGSNTLTAVATDPAGNEGTASVEVTFEPADIIPPEVTITNPLDGTVFDISPITVSGAIDDDTASVEVNGIAGIVENGTFTATGVLLVQGSNTLTAVATDPAGNEGTASVEVTFEPADNIPPEVTITDPLDGAVFDTSPITVSGTIDDDTASVEVNGIVATVNNGAFTATGITLVEGTNTVIATATDPAGNIGTDSIDVVLQTGPDDTNPPSLLITSPIDGGFTIDNQPTIQLSYSDPSGVNTASFGFTGDGIVLDVDCETTDSNASCTPTSPLPEGQNVVVVSVEDHVGNTATAQVTFSIDSVPAEIDITGPADGLITKDDSIDVTGTVSSDVETVEVNGVTAALDSGGFTATVSLREGKNMLVAVATKSSGRTSTDSVDVTRDIFAPIVSIDSPRDGFISVNDTIAVTGKVNDIVNGATNAQVFVNGIEATVADGAFMVMDIALVRGANEIEAIATDAVGNEGRRSITVVFQQPVGRELRKVPATVRLALSKHNYLNR